MVPGLDADALVDALALRVSAGASSPTPTWSPRTPAAAATAPEYELLDTGAFDDGRYWDIDGRLRQGGARTISASA